MVIAQDVLVANRVLHQGPKRPGTTELRVDVIYVATTRPELDRRPLLSGIAGKTESRRPENEHEPACGQLTKRLLHKHLLIAGRIGQFRQVHFIAWPKHRSYRFLSRRPWPDGEDEYG